MRVLLILALCFPFTGCVGHPPAGTPQDPEQATTAENKTNSADVSQTVCKREGTVGTHFRKKACRTARQMEEEEKAGREVVERSSRRGPTGGE